MPKKELNTIELLRIILGGFRDEIRKGARELVEALPKDFRKRQIGKFVGILAQIVERFEWGGVEEIISDAIEIVSDEIGKQLIRPEEAETLKNVREILEDAQKRLRETTDIETEKNRIIAELQALADIVKVLKIIEENLTTETTEEKKREKGRKEEAKKTNWDMISQGINAVYKIIKETSAEKIAPELQRLVERFKKIIDELNKKGDEAAERIKKWPRPF